jgi:hypothetical protein
LHGPFIPAALVTLFVVFLWASFQAPVSAMARFVAYELAYVVLPGTLAYMLLTGARRAGVRQLAVGWALGYALEIAAFSATAASGLRNLFSFYPVVTCALALRVALRWHRRSAGTGAEAHAAGPVVETTGGPSVWPWALAVLALILLGYMASGLYTLTPLPWTLHGPVSYDQDHVWELSLVGEALRDFPLQIPNLAGATLHYHYFAYLDLAAVSQVTHLATSLVLFRLYVIPIIIVLGLEMFVLGRRLGGGRSSVGVTAVALAFLVGPFQPWPQPPSEFFTHLYEGPSASYALGLVLLLAVMIEFTDMLDSGPAAASRGGRAVLGRQGSWLVLAVLLAACAGAKAVILPELLGSLTVLVVYVWFTDRRPLSTVLTATVVVGALFLLSFVLLYAGSHQPIQIQPFAEINSLQPFSYLRSQAHGFFPALALVTAVGVIIETFKALFPLVLGLIGVVYATGRRPPVQLAWPFALLGVGLFVDYFASDVHGGQVYFLYYGYVPAAALAAVGLRELWLRAAPRVRVSTRLVAWIGAIALLAWAAEGPIGSRPGQPVAPAFWGHFGGDNPPSTNDNLTPQLYAGLRWIAQHTPRNAVLAVNNRWQDLVQSDARYCYYSAFAERQVMLECDIGTNHIDQYLSLSASLATPTRGPYPERTLLNTRIFLYGDPWALGVAMARYHVSYLVLDLVHKNVANVPAVEALGKVVFANRSVVIVGVGRAAHP